MAHPEEGNAIYWYDPDPRTIIPIDEYHLSKRLKRTMRQEKFEVKLNHDFRGTMQGCAEAAPGRESTWISDDIIDLYSALHQNGYAQSVETYLNGELVGGVYGVSIRGLFAGESMFSRVTDASKVALGTLLELLKASGYLLFDVQFTTKHLKRFGATEISRKAYHEQLERALNVAPLALGR